MFFYSRILRLDRQSYDNTNFMPIFVIFKCISAQNQILFIKSSSCLRTLIKQTCLANIFGELQNFVGYALT